MIRPDEVAIGSFVWSKAEDGNGMAARGGVVVDADEHAVWVLDDRASDLIVGVRSRGSRHQTSRKLVGLIRIPYADLATVEPGGSKRIHSFARAAWLVAGLGYGLVGRDDDLVMVNHGLTLVHSTGAFRG